MRLIIFCITFCQYIMANAQSPEFYTGAVVEYATLWNNTQSAGVNMRRNVDEYLINIGEASRQGADIIVFPECGLTTVKLPANTADLQLYTTVIPDAKKRAIPCGKEEYTDVLKRLSCAAKENKIYVVVNLPERLMIDTTDENSNKFAIFNTNIVFDREGTIIAKYRKYNLFVEPGFNTTETPDITTFETDFGVTFGTFICFDILFAKPAMQLLKDNPKVTDIVYPTAWFSELPFATAVQVQAGWARSTGVNLLAAGYSNPANFSGGSGIFQADGDITYTVPVSKLTTLVVKQIKKIKQRAVPDTVDTSTAKVNSVTGKVRTLGKMQTMKENMSNYTTMLLNDTDIVDQQVCHGKFCCTFNVKFPPTDNVDYRYRMVVYEGPRLFGIETNSIQVCGLAACKDTTKESCGERIETSTQPQEFEEISIKGDFKNDDDTVTIPSNVLYDLSILKPSDFTYKVTGAGSHKTIEMRTTQTVDHILGFGIYGITKSSAASSFNVLPLIVISIFTLVIWNYHKN